MPPANEQEHRAHVLYVDDEEPNLIVFRAACGHLFPTLTATDGARALELMQTHEVAVVLADQRMPGLTGVEVLARARRLQPAAVRMLVTAYSNLEAAVAAINEGMVRRYVSKPWTTAEMVATVTDAYQVYSTEQSLQGVKQRLLETERYYALGVVSAGIAHELRNPATWVGNSLQLGTRCLEQARTLLAGDDPDLSALESLLDRAMKLLENAFDGSQRIGDIVRSVEGTTRQPQAQDVDMKSLWQTTLNLVSYHTGGRTKIEHQGDPWPVLAGSQTALGQVLSNVLINAVEAVRSSPEGRVWVASHVRDGQLEVHVEDNGPGIAETDLERIFDPFHTAGKVGGTGLGLAISRRIAREHGGDLTAEPSERGGARFVLRLSLGTGATAPGPRSPLTTH